MTKYFTLFFLFASFAVLLGFGSYVAADETQSTLINPSATPTPKHLAEIVKIELDRNEVVIPCPPLPENSSPKIDSPCYNDNGLVMVKTIINNPRNIPLIYQYTVSGGRIVGQGEKVVWDLKSTRPGNYQISAAIDEGRGFGNETAPQEVEIKDSCCCIFCACPTLSVTGGGDVKAGETVSFTANVSGGTAIDINYTWTISQGEIIEGQGTPDIKVKTTKEMNGYIKATVEIGGSLCAECPRTAFETATIIK